MQSLSKTSGVFATFHETKCAAVARLFEGRSPEFRSHRRMSPWNSKQERFCETLHACFLCSLYNQFLPLYIKSNQRLLNSFRFIQIVISFSFILLHVIYDFSAFRFSIGTADKINTIPRTFCHVKASPKKR